MTPIPNTQKHKGFAMVPIPNVKKHIGFAMHPTPDRQKHNSLALFVANESHQDCFETSQEKLIWSKPVEYLMHIHRTSSPYPSLYDSASTLERQNDAEVR